MFPTGNIFNDANSYESIVKKSENIRRNNNQYKVGDKILVKSKKKSKHELPVALVSNEYFLFCTFYNI